MSSVTRPADSSCSSPVSRHHLYVLGASSVLAISGFFVFGAGVLLRKRTATENKQDERSESLTQLCEVLRSLPDEEWCIVKHKLDSFLGNATVSSPPELDVEIHGQQQTLVRDSDEGNTESVSARETETKIVVSVHSTPTVPEDTKVQERESSSKKEANVIIMDSSDTNQLSSVNKPVVPPHEGTKKEFDSPAADRPEIRRFKTMLKVGINPEAVKAKMLSEGLDPSILFNEQASSDEQVNQTGRELESEVKAEPVRDPALAKYETMLRVGIHPDAVRSKMRSEGLDPASLFPNGSQTTKSSDHSSASKSVANATSLPKPIRVVTPLGELIPSDRLSDKSLWRSTQGIQEAVKIDALAMRRIESIFKASKKATTLPIKDAFGDENAPPPNRRGGRNDQALAGKKSGGRKPAPTTSTFISARRAQNLQIGLAKFKLAPELICDAVSKMEPELFGRKDDDNLQLLLRLLPTEEEMKSLAAYTGDESRLSDIERLFRLFATRVPDVGVRVESMIFFVRFPMQVKDLRSEMEVVARALRLVRESNALVAVLSLALAVGLGLATSLSGGGVPSNSGGLSVHGLSERLARTKTPDGKISASDVIAGLFRSSAGKDALPLMESSFSTFRSLMVLESEINELDRGIDKRGRLNSSPDEAFVSNGKQEVGLLREQFGAVRGLLQNTLEFFGEPVDRPLSVFFQDMCGLIGCIQASLVTNKYAAAVLESE